jgi:hypothetical protein
MAERYLYGASVQGIQDFIFKTGKLKEITGASAIVENICTELFRECSGATVIHENPNWIIGAAGNIRYIFESLESCKKVVKLFPKLVMESAPGITISQAVVKFNDGNFCVSDINTIEDKLKIQRNLPIKPTWNGWMVTERSQKTGEPMVSSKDELDRPSLLKQENSNQNLISKIVPYFDIKTIKDRFDPAIDTFTINDEKSWIAVIHCDGNGLGNILRLIGEKLDGKDQITIIKTLKSFSALLDIATIEAARRAFSEEILEKENQIAKHKEIPFRPVVLGGDDLTVILNSKYAMIFTYKFLTYFEKETETKLGPLFSSLGISVQKLTVCAGIAYIKESYPFHYAINMANQLCGIAKSKSREH